MECKSEFNPQHKERHSMKVISERTLLEEITIEWEFEHNGETHTIREYSGIDGHQVWFNDQVVADSSNDLLDGMSATDILSAVKV